jgi:hypothetical protein
MAKLKEYLYNIQNNPTEFKGSVSLIKARTLFNNSKHQSTQTWSADMPDLEGEALADAEKQFDYDSWMGEHGIGE